MGAYSRGIEIQEDVCSLRDFRSNNQAVGTLKSRVICTSGVAAFAMAFINKVYTRNPWCIACQPQNTCSNKNATYPEVAYVMGSLVVKEVRCAVCWLLSWIIWASIVWTLNLGMLLFCKRLYHTLTSSRQKIVGSASCRSNDAQSNSNLIDQRRLLVVWPFLHLTSSSDEIVSF